MVITLPFMAAEVGFEPTTKRLTAARSTTELLGSVSILSFGCKLVLNTSLAAEPGFEPGLEDPKSPVLPLHNSALYITGQISLFDFSPCLVPKVGLEPT